MKRFFYVMQDVEGDECLVSSHPTLGAAKAAMIALARSSGDHECLSIWSNDGVIAVIQQFARDLRC